MYAEVRTAFTDELKPDIPEKVTSYVAYFYKYIWKIGSFRTSYIVLVGHRECESVPQEYAYFRAFSYDTSSEKKKEIEPVDYYYQWTFLTQVKFEPSPTQDVVFKYFDCLECESTTLLSSFTYDQKDRTWKRRIWPDNDPHILIDSDTQIGDDFWIYDCLYKITDINSDGFADIAVRCRVTGEETKKVTDELFLYTIQKGSAKKIQVGDKKTIDKMTKVLCDGQNSPLCTAK